MLTVCIERKGKYNVLTSDISLVILILATQLGYLFNITGAQCV